MALNILVVDDSSVMRSIIIKTLHLCGLPLGEIYQAVNGLEGLQALEENWIDLALVDINMPVMDGEEMIEKIRRKPDIADLPIIVISTESSRKRVEALRRKCDGFVHKPFTPEELRKAIMKVIGGLNEGEGGGYTLQVNGPDF
ncbi:response regulator [Candidatus Poribacteria bacterium]|nr:response regulator [Candidatus Poribacteria bacterium]